MGKYRILIAKITLMKRLPVKANGINSYAAILKLNGILTS